MKNRPVGRQKSIGTGIGNVFRRGGGLGGGPVGNAGGYSDRSGGSRSGRGGGFFPRGGGRSGRGGCLRTIIIIAVVLYVLYGMISGNQFLPGLDTNGTPGPQNSIQNNGAVFADEGEYPVNTAVSELARSKRTQLKGNGADTATVLVYLCGTDLESKSGMATADLQEMISAEIAGNVNIIVETGGASRWQNKIISSTANQRYRVTSEGLEVLERNLGKKSMVDPATLSDFIRYGKDKYPADRYSLILWDHGGGSLSGYGYDENFPNDSMSLDEVGTALKNGGVSFDWIGFDACLMAALESAIVLEPYADYMIASEEVEPGIGWYYTGWITALSQNTSIPTVDLGKKLIDDYVKEVRAKTPESQATLSLIDLAELKGTVPPAFSAFTKSASGLIDNNQYQVVSDARAGSKEFAASSKINQIDLIHFAENIGTAESKSLAQVLRECIKYNRCSANITNAQGVSIFFPYGRLNKLNAMLDTYEEIGMDDSYSRCIKSFASVTAGGQVVSPGSGNMLETLLNGMSGSAQSAPSTPEASAASLLLDAFLSSGDYGRITGTQGPAPSWLDVDRMKSSADYYEENRLDASALRITEKGGQRVLALSEKQWDLVQHMEMNVFLDDGEGFIDLGLDNVYEYNNDGDLIMEYDGTWLALNGNIVSYYMMSDDRHGDTYSIKGRVPAMLNGQLVDIILVFDNTNPQGKILGAQIKYEEAQSETVPKGLIEMVAGDKIDFLCDYYTYDGQYSDTYYLGNPFTVTGQWQIENLSLGDRGYQMTYRITDIYDNTYWTPSIRD